MNIEDYVCSKEKITDVEYDEMLSLFGKEKTNEYLDYLVLHQSKDISNIKWYIDNIYIDSVMPDNSIRYYLKLIHSYPLLSDNEVKEYNKIIREKKKDIVILKEVVLPGTISNYVLDFDIIYSSLINCNNRKYILKLLKKSITSVGQDESSKMEMDIFNNLDKCNVVANTLSEEELIEQLNMVIEYRNVRNKFINSNLRFVVYVAKKYYSNDSSLQFLDLIQYGNIGLIKAVDRYDYTNGAKFITFAYYWIRHSITREIALNSRTISMTVSEYEKLRKIKRVSNQLEAILGRVPTDLEIANSMGISVLNYQETINNSTNTSTISLDSKIITLNSEDSGTSLGNLIIDEEDKYAEVEYDMLKHNLEIALNTLTEKERLVMSMRYGFAPYDRVYTLQEIGDMLSLTRERIRQIEEKSLKKLRKPENRLMVL